MTASVIIIDVDEGWPADISDSSNISKYLKVVLDRYERL